LSQENDGLNSANIIITTTTTTTIIMENIFEKSIISKQTNE
jgi:ornithine cyclodeaminase/alanine dehydrogenase-like protein (mu-crystallin family)